MKKQVLLVGERPGEESYHPAAPVFPLVEQSLSPRFRCHTAYGMEWTGLLDQYPVIINYLDRFRPDALTDNQADSLARWVEKGGGMVVLHSGVCLAANPAFFRWLGFRFTHHPAQEILSFRPVGSHPLTEGVGAFAFRDEPYHYAFDPDLAAFSVVMEYTFPGEQAPLPAVWYRRYGKGAVVNLCMGHTALQAGDPHTLRLVQNSVNWLFSLGE